MNRSKRGHASAPSQDDLAQVCAPAGLQAYTFEIGQDEYCLFEVDFAEIATPSQLTPAERKVTALLLEGLSNEGIANARGTSPCTVANQLQSIYTKLGLSGRAELIGYCVERARLQSGRAAQASE